jgi:polysaccharide biosynthesis transport protein
MIQAEPRQRRPRIVGFPAGRRVAAPAHVLSQETPGAGVSDHKTDLTGFLRIIGRNALPILLVLLTALGLAVAFLATTEPTYSTSATVLVDPRSPRIVTEEITQGGLTSDLALVESQVPIITSAAVLGAVVDKFNLTEDPEFMLYQRTGLVEDLKDLLRGARGAPERRTYAMERLAQQLQIHRAQKTYVLEIEISSNSAVKAAKLANGIADAYIAEQVAAKAKAAGDANALINARLEELRNDLLVAETRADEFRKANQIITSEGGIVAEQQLGKLNTELATARAVAAEARARQEEVTALLKAGAPVDSLPGAVSSALIQKLREQLAQVSRRAAALGAQFQPRHPVMQDINSQKRELRSQIAAELKRIVAASKSEADIAAKREKEILVAIEAAKATVSRSNTAGIRLRELEREVETNRALLQAFLVRAKETQEQQNLSSANARIVSAAGVPSFPSWPRPWLILALGGLSGLGLGVAGALVRDHFDTSVRQRRSLSQLTGLPILAALPVLVAKDGFGGRLLRRARGAVSDLSVSVGLSDVMLTLSDTKERDASGFRQATLRLLRRLIDDGSVHEPRSIMLVSPDTGAGTTTTALALAYAAAVSGERVLLVDATSTDPELSLVFGGHRPRHQDVVLDNKQHLASLTTTDVRTGLTLLPIALADLRHLKTRQLRRLVAGIDRLSEDFDLVIIDAGAILQDATAINLLPAADKIVLIARSGATTRADLEDAEALFHSARERLAGTVLTMAPRHAG